MLVVRVISSLQCPCCVCCKHCLILMYGHQPSWSAVCTDDDADTIPAFIQSISLVSDGPSTSLTRPGLNVTLTFTISDETDLTSASQPPPSWTVTIGPEGSAPPVFISASTPSTSRSFVYRWTVPTAPQFTGIGYFINVSDAAGNFRSVAVSAAINIGMDCERCRARMFCSLCSIQSSLEPLTCSCVDC